MCFNESFGGHECKKNWTVFIKSGRDSIFCTDVCFIIWC